MRNAIVVVMLIAVSFSLASQEIAIWPAREGPAQTDPRSSLSLAIRIANSSTTDRRVALSVQLPDEWRQLIAPMPTMVAAQTESTQLVSIFVPLEARAGTYAVEIRATDADTEEALSSVVVPVEVLPHVELQMTILDGSSYVITGEMIELPFRVTNSSNMELQVELSHRSVYDYETQFVGADGNSVRIPANSSVRVVVLIQTGGFLSQMVDYNVVLLAEGVPVGELEMYGDLSATASSRARVEIIPEVSEEAPPFHTIPASLSVATAHSFSDGWNGDISAVLKGEGSLDQAGRHNVEFQLSPSFDLDMLTFGAPQDEYYLAYLSDAAEVRIGNEGYSVSPLVSSSLAGWGALGRVTPGPFTASGLYSYQESNSSSTIGSMLEYRYADAEYPNLHLTTALNGLWTIGDHWLAGSYSRYRNEDELSADLDLAIGGAAGIPLAFAARADVDGTYAGFGLEGEVLYAMPGFPGQETDRYYFSATAGTPQWGDLPALTAFYSQQQSNLLRDPVLTVAPRTIEGRLAGELNPVGSEVRLTGGWRIVSHVDRMETPSFSTVANSLTLGAVIPGPILSFRVGATATLDYDLLVGSPTFLQRYDAQLRLMAPSRFEFVSDLEFEGERESGVGVRDYSTALTIQRSDELTEWRVGASFELSESAGTVQSVLTRIEGSLDVSVTPRSVITFGGNLQYSSGGAISDFSGGISIGYQTPMSIPVTREKNVGSIEGVVYEPSSGLPLEDVIVRIAERAVVSSERGVFRFTGLPPAEYYLEINAQRVGSNRIADLPSPIVVSATADEVSRIEIPVVEGGVVNGRVVLFEAAPGTGGMFPMATGDGASDEYQPDQLIESGGLSGVIVHLQQGGQHRRVLTREDGAFTFRDVRPGEWSVSLETSRLPRFHRVREEHIDVTVGAGDTASLEFSVVPVRRVVTIVATPQLVVQPRGGLQTEDAAQQETAADSDAATEPATDTEPAATVEPASAAQPPVTEPTTVNAPDELVSGLSARVRQHVLDLRENAPLMLGLPWGATPEEVQVLLTGLVDPMEVDDSESESTDQITLVTSGVVQLSLLGDIELTFHDPRQDGSELMLVGSRVTISAVDNMLSPALLYHRYGELVTQFVNQWESADIEAERTGTTETRSANVGGIEASFTIDFDANTISIRYRDPMFD